MAFVLLKLGLISLLIGTSIAFLVRWTLKRETAFPRNYRSANPLPPALVTTLLRIEEECWTRCRQRASTRVAMYETIARKPVPLSKAAKVRASLSTVIQKRETPPAEVAAAILAYGHVPPRNREYAIPMELVVKLKYPDELVQVAAIVAMCRLSPVDAHGLIPDFYGEPTQKVTAVANEVFRCLQREDEIVERAVSSFRDELDDEDAPELIARRQ